MDDFLPILLDLAKKCIKNGDIPVSCIVFKDGKMISSGYNNRFFSSSVTGHAEINAILEAERILGDYRLNGCDLLVTLKPCSMCYEVIKEARIDKIYYLLDQNCQKIYPQDKYIKLDLENNEIVKEYKAIFDDFFKKIR